MSQIDAHKLLTSPQFWTGILHGLAVGVEKGSPDYTVAARVARTVETLLGQTPIHTDKAHAVSVAQAVEEGFRAAGVNLSEALAGARKE